MTYALGLVTSFVQESFNVMTHHADGPETVRLQCTAASANGFAFNARIFASQVGAVTP